MLRGMGHFRQYSNSKKLARKNPNLPILTRRVHDSEARGEGTGRIRGRHRERIATIGHISGFFNPAESIARSLNAALNPDLAPKPVRSMEDMSDAEIAAIEARYGMRVKR